MQKKSKLMLEALAKQLVDQIEEDMAMMSMGGTATANGAMNPTPVNTGNATGNGTNNNSNTTNTNTDTALVPQDSFTLSAIVNSKSAPFNGSRLQTERGAHLGISKVAAVIKMIGAKDSKAGKKTGVH